MEIPFVLGALTVMLGLIVVAVQMFRNGAPSETVAHVLHEVEQPASPGVRRGA